MSIDLSKVRTCVFWDIEDFQVPDGEDIDSIYQNINSALTNKGYQKFGMLEIRVYGEKYKIWDELILAGIMVVPVGDKCARVRRMIRDILVWALENPSEYHIPQNVMVISKDIFKDKEFLSVLLGLEGRAYNVLLAESDYVSSLNQLPFVSSVWLWNTLLAGGCPFHQSGNQKPTTPTYSLSSQSKKKSKSSLGDSRADTDSEQS